MKWNIYYKLRGPSGKTIDSPNMTNPVQADTLNDVLKDLIALSPSLLLGVEIVGLRIEPILEVDSSNVR